MRAYEGFSGTSGGLRGLSRKFQKGFNATFQRLLRVFQRRFKGFQVVSGGFNGFHVSPGCSISVWKWFLEV